MSVGKIRDAGQSREVLVVLGVGRSGTSLVMQALEELGVRTSERMIPPNISNPKGFYEDADIVEIHKHLLGSLAACPSMPLQSGWLNTPDARRALDQLKQLVDRQLSAGPGMWAFKDPRTATFLPLWIRLFNQLKIVPHFVLAIRRPEAIIQSFSQQYGKDQAFSELILLQRTIDSLYYTGGYCHILSYESWFSDPRRTFCQLADFVLGASARISDKAPPVVEQLNRTQCSKIEVHNPMIRELHEELEACDEKSGNRKVLMAIVQRHREVLDAFASWHKTAGERKQQHDKCRRQLTEAHQRLRDCEIIQKRLECREAALDEYQSAIKALERLY